jgi:hypothetical protein
MHETLFGRMHRFVGKRYADELGKRYFLHEMRFLFVAIWLMSSQKAGISACSLQRQIGCSYKTAGRVLARIRCAMARSECVQRAVG